MTSGFWVLPTSFGLGFLAAIPVGASQVEVAKRALARRPGAALLCAAGTTTSDMMYGTLALFGFAPFMERPGVMTAFRGVGAVLLAILAVATWLQARKVHAPDERKRWAGKRYSYATGFLIGVTYPPIMLTWLMGVALVKSLGLGSLHTNAMKSFFVVTGGAGMFTYMLCLTAFLYKTHHFYSERTLRTIYKVLAVLLGLLALGFLFGHLPQPPKN